MTTRKWLRGIAIVGLIAALSLFLSPSVPQLVQIGPKPAYAQCDSGDPTETGSFYFSACSISVDTTLISQVIANTADGFDPLCFFPTTDEDWFSASLAVGETLDVTVTNTSVFASSDFDVVIYNSSLVAQVSDTSTTVSPAVTFVAPSLGTYYIQITNKGTPDVCPTTTPDDTLYYSINFDFTPAPATLTILGAGLGSGTVTGGSVINCTVTAGITSGTCNETGAAGTFYTLTAVPDAFSLFVSWTGCDSLSGGLNQVCNITVNTSDTVQVNFSVAPPPVSPDGYEPDDTQFQANIISASCSPIGATISPWGDHDFFMFPANPGSISVSALSTFGVSLNLSVTQTANTPFVTTNNGSPNPSVTGTITQSGFTLIEVWAASPTAVSFYSLTVCNLPPPTRTPTPTPGATPTATATPNLGNGPDVAESNNDFGASFRLSPGNSIQLNFNSGFLGVPDIDYFVMTVKTDVTYTCQTSNLGTGADTIVNIFGPLPSDSNFIAGNDDINAQAGNVASKVTWKSTYDGEVFVQVSQNGGLTVPGLASYMLTCAVGTGISTGGVSSGSGGVASGGGGSSSSSAKAIQLIATPTGQPTPVVVPIAGLTINVVIAYDANDNGVIDLAEGVSNMSIRVTNPNTNTELSHGFTDQHGSLTLIVSTEQDKDVLVVVPFLSIGKRFSMSSGSAEWHVLLPASSLPGVIP